MVWKRVQVEATLANSRSDKYLNISSKQSLFTSNKLSAISTINRFCEWKQNTLVFEYLCWVGRVTLYGTKSTAGLHFPKSPDAILNCRMNLLTYLLVVSRGCDDNQVIFQGCFISSHLFAGRNDEPALSCNCDSQQTRICARIDGTRMRVKANEALTSRSDWEWIVWPSKSESNV